MQPRFLYAIAKKCREYHINVAIETCGCGDYEAFAPCLDYIDFIYFDIKHMDSGMPVSYTHLDVYKRQEERIVLTFDVGTQSSRALLINNRGEILGKGQIRHDPPYISREPDWAEQDADFYYRSICEAAQKLKTETSLWDRIEAVSLTTIRDTVICVDKVGKPLRLSLIHI